MAIAKVCGTETEYGIVLRGVAESNPIAASSALINAYAQQMQRRVGWDFEDEAPGRDARGYAREGTVAPEVETNLVNTVLTNGGRYYVDHAHPEYSTPECATPRELVLYDKAGEMILAESMRAAARTLPDGQGIVVYKNNSDGKGNSYGCHENYLVDRAVPFGRLAEHLIPYFVTRQVFTGAGKVGTEVPFAPARGVPYQISQRADFFEEEIGLETTLKRPIINTRDEPHADAQRYRRLHVIVGDANLAEVSTFLKVGVTSVVLAMIEDDWIAGLNVAIAAPVAAMRAVSWDVGLGHRLELAEGGNATALQIQWQYLEAARKYAEARGLECIGPDGAGLEVLDRWEATLTALESDPMSLSAQLDWVAKYQLLDAYRERHQIAWDDPRLAAMDLQYHDVRPEKSLFARLPMERLLEDDAVNTATEEPPRDTRAYFRGRCLQRWGSSIAAANWDSLVFDLGGDPLRRVPMMEPLRGTAAHVDKLLEGCSGPAELLERLGS
ncbi:MAG TPA: depupylase/deamidase Dop [Acidimicrobiales bacterium]|nr:depupylase/deamidase Dop [Acidimicrobiales bacterium]